MKILRSSTLPCPARQGAMPIFLVLALAVALGACESPGVEADEQFDGGQVDAESLDVSSDVGRDTVPDTTIDRDAATDAVTDTETDAPTDDAGEQPLEGWCSTQDTALARAVTGLEPGEWVEFPIEEDLGPLDLHGHLMSWSDTGVWNPVDRRVQWVGSPGSCCANPATYQLVTYDVATDTWSAEPTAWLDAIGHAYDGNALDPSTGTHYFARADDIRGYDGSEWTPVAQPPINGPIASGLTWFGANPGLVFVGRSGDVAHFDGDAWQTIDAGEVTWGTYHVFAEYNPVHEVVWLGAGNNAVKKHAVLDAQLGLTARPDAPTSLNATGTSMKTYDPRSGVFIVTADETDQWFTYDIETDTWSEITDAIRAARPDSWTVDMKNFAVPIDDCGVIMYVGREAVAGAYRAYLYRHSE